MSKIKSDAHLYLSIVGAADPAPSSITSIASAAGKVTVTATNSLANGAFALIDGTGNAYLDGQAWRVENASATKFDLADADDVKSGGATGGTFLPFDLAGATPELLSACMASITVAGQAPDSIAMDDMCGSTTVLGDAKPPQITFSGFSDKDSEGYKNLWRASITDPKPTVWALIDFTDGGGYIFGPAQVGEISITATTNQGLQFNGSATFTEVPTYSWAL